MVFENKEEFYKLMEMMAEKIKNDKILFDTLVATNVNCQMTISNIESAFVTVKTKNNKLEFEYGELSVKPDATVSATDELFVKFWQGKVNLMTAMAKRQIKVGGAVSSIIKLVPRLSGCYPKWIEVLKEVDRQELIVK